MASGAKRKTTIAKLNRESKLRERRLIKQAKKEARKQAPSDQHAMNAAAIGAAAEPNAEQALREPDAERPPGSALGATGT